MTQSAQPTSVWLTKKTFDLQIYAGTDEIQVGHIARALLA